MKIFLLLLSLLLLPSCANLPADPSKMTAEQLTAWAKDRNANLACSTYKGVYGTGVVNYVVLDKGIISSGSVSIDAECKITITNTTSSPGK